MSKAEDNFANGEDQGANDADRSLNGGTATRKAVRQRVQLDLVPDVYDRVFQVQLVNGLDSVRSVFREAFRLYEWFTVRRMQGWRIQLVHEDGTVAHVDLGLIGERPTLGHLLQADKTRHDQQVKT